MRWLLPAFDWILPAHRWIPETTSYTNRSFLDSLIPMASDMDPSCAGTDGFASGFFGVFDECRKKKEGRMDELVEVDAGPPLGRFVPLPWLAVSEWASRVHLNHISTVNLSQMLKHKYKMHPTAFWIKSLALRLKLDSLARKFMGLASQSEKRKWRSGKMKADTLFASSMVLCQFLFNVQECCCIFEASTFVAGEDADGALDNESLFHTIVQLCRSMQTAVNLHIGIQKVNDTTRKLIRDEFESCAVCGTIIPKLFPMTLGIEKVTPYFVCLPCQKNETATMNILSKDDDSKSNKTNGIAKKRKRKKKKRKKKKNEVNSENKSPLSSSTSATPLPCTQADPVEICDNRTKHRLESPEMHQSTNPRNGMGVSNDDLVDYLIKTGSIIALNSFMDQLGLDR